MRADPTPKLTADVWQRYRQAAEDCQRLEARNKHLAQLIAQQVRDNLALQAEVRELTRDVRDLYSACAVLSRRLLIEAERARAAEAAADEAKAIDLLPIPVPPTRPHDDA